MNKTEREGVLRKALKAAFEPRFAEIKKLFAAEIIVPAEFADLLANDRYSPYVAFQFTKHFQIGEYAAVEPIYGDCYHKPEYSNPYWCKSDNASPITNSTIMRPHKGQAYVTITNQSIVDLYDTTWQNYIDAREKLNSILLAYKSRDKFEVDFPELAGYLPARKEKVKALTVVVDNEKRRLKELGVM